MKLILGSASRWRRQILKEAGFEFAVMAADIDEKKIRHAEPEVLALEIAKAKATALLPKIQEPALLITTDQIVVCNGEVFEKPCDPDEARRFMHCYNAHPALTVTAVVVTNCETGEQVSGVDVVKVEFHTIPETEMERLIADKEIFFCAGGFQVEGLGGELNKYIKHVDGDVDSVKGLPMRLLKRLLNEINNYA